MRYDIYRAVVLNAFLFGFSRTIKQLEMFPVLSVHCDSNELNGSCPIVSGQLSKRRESRTKYFVKRFKICHKIYYDRHAYAF